MRSPMVMKAEWIDEKDKDNYSDLMVLQSNAGYYIGTMYTYPNGAYKHDTEPGSRDTMYFNTKEEAEKVLGLLCKGEATHLLRKEP